MDSELQQYINQVEDFEIDPGLKRLSFVERLARENNWSIDFALSVVLEYKRFCILAMRSGHRVTPSEFVDQAWHLHLTYTRSYWERFCPEALGGPLHHEPTQGGRPKARNSLTGIRRRFGVTSGSLVSHRRVISGQNRRHGLLMLALGSGSTSDIPG